MCGGVSAGVWTWMRNGGAYATLDERDGVAPLVMNRLPMRGWLRVAPDVVADNASLDEWVARCIDYVKGTVNAAARPTRRQGAP